MIKSILVPLDGSPFAEQALPWAACLAKVCGAHLELVRVHDPVPPWTIATEGAVAATTVDPTIRDAEEQYLANCAARLEEGGFTGVTRKLIEGDVVEQIACHAEDNAFGLVVLATHGRGAISRLWLGSVSDALVRRLTVPVLLIRPTEGTAVPRAERFRKVFVALDGSTESESAIAPALALAAAPARRPLAQPAVTRSLRKVTITYGVPTLDSLTAAFFSSAFPSSGLVK